MEPGRILDTLKSFTTALTNNYSSMLGGQPENRLKDPVQELLRTAGATMGFNVSSATETQVQGTGRLDIAVGIGGLISGYVELKSCGAMLRG